MIADSRPSARRRLSGPLLAALLVALVTAAPTAAQGADRAASPGAASAGSSQAEAAPVGTAPADVARVLAPDVRAGPRIDPDAIADHVDVLASDLFEGRHAGTAAERRAAAYIVSVLEELDGLEPMGEHGTWFQTFKVPAPGGPFAGTNEARNILALLPGTDPELRTELIVLGAHYDHVGYGKSNNALDFIDDEIHNGADDNASGTAAVLELAAWFSEPAHRPRRSLMFQWYSGEELGLIGSRHYVEHPAWPLSQTIFMINLDMVGRLTARKLVVGGTGTADFIPELVDDLGEQLELDVMQDAPGAAPSDNTSFYEKKIPVVFLFTGLHEDYHRVTDDPHKINAEGTATVADFARGFVQALDAMPRPPVFTLAPGAATLFIPTVYVGAVFGGTRAIEPPAGLPRPAGAVVTVVIPDSPAGEAGVREGDVVVGFDGHLIEGLADMVGRLETIDLSLPEMTWSILRPTEDDYERITLKVQPRLR